MKEDLSAPTPEMIVVVDHPHPSLISSVWASPYPFDNQLENVIFEPDSVYLDGTRSHCYVWLRPCSEDLSNLWKSKTFLEAKIDTFSQDK